jgi:endonuclease/exonuclease/phosphatase family metal-dependent hydrolase
MQALKFDYFFFFFQRALPSFAYSMKLRLATWNLRFDRPADGADRWPERRAGLASQVRAIGADVLATQEGLERQLVYLSEELGGRSAQTAHRIGACRTPGGADDEHCAVFVNAKGPDGSAGRLTVVASGDFWLSEAPDDPGSVGWDAELPRVATWCVLGDGSNAGGSAGVSVAVINCHFDHQGAVARASSAKLVAERARRLSSAHGGCPVILCGDFNAEKVGEPVFDTLVAEGWTDAFEACARDGGVVELGTCAGSTFHAFRGPAFANDPENWSATARDALFLAVGGGDGTTMRDAGSNLHIDWIMVPPGVRVHRAEVWTSPLESPTADGSVSQTTEGGIRYPSDHFAVIADLELGGGDETVRKI